LIPLFAALALLGFAGGVLTGHSGLNGSVYMIPLLLYLPPYLSGTALDVKEVAAVSIVQVV
jgi:uncharacterized membrane protein YfcA